MYTTFSSVLVLILSLPLNLVLTGLNHENLFGFDTDDEAYSSGRFASTVKQTPNTFSKEADTENILRSWHR